MSARKEKRYRKLQNDVENNSRRLEAVEDAIEGISGTSTHGARKIKLAWVMFLAAVLMMVAAVCTTTAKSANAPVVNTITVSVVPDILHEPTSDIAQNRE